MNDFSVKSVLKKNVMTMALFGIYVLFVILAFLLKSTNMLEPSIVSSLIEQNAYVFVLGAGMLMCMLTGGNIDLSVGSVVCFVGAIVGLFSVENRIIHMPLSVPVVLLIAIGVGVAYGSLLGFLIAYVRIPPWIATLAGYLAFRGLGTQVLTKASETNAISIPSTDALGELSDIFSGRLFETDWGEINIPCIIMGLIGIAVFAFLTISARRKKIVKGYQADPLWYVVTKLVLVSLVILFFTVEFSFDGGMPTVVLWILGVLILYGIVTEKTTIGRHFMTVGGNAEAARLSGINNKRVMFFAYFNMAILTVIAALIVTVRTGAANSFAGQEYELDAIAACIVGGVSAYGGAGTVIGMVVGATLIGVINQGMSLIGVDQNWIKIVKGLVLLAAVVFEIFSKNSKAKASKTKTQKEKTAELEDAIAKAQEELEKASDEALNEDPAVPSAENVVTTES
ncbi:MAG: sugar ABC transporter permease [Clostridiales bacterium]|nr:sugar ABC transporter permease [Clostridiales bacterium]